MNYLITEQQNDRIIDMMKKFAENYSEKGIIRTKADIVYNAPRDAYIVYPTFYVKKKEGFPSHVYRHLLAQRIQEYIGIKTLSANHAEVIEI